MKLLGICATALFVLLGAAPRANADIYYVTVSGLAGEADYEQRFSSSVNELDRVLKGSGPAAHVFTLSKGDATRERLIDALQQIAKAARPDDDFVLILIGHGSYDGVEYKFNLVGPDVSAIELARLCNPIASRRQLVVITTSSSGGGLAALQRKGRAVITATKSGTEKNATVFARYFVQAFEDPAADVDKNEAVSALEAFQYAERKTADFYSEQKRLATEHPLFEDVGSGEPVRQSGSGEGRMLAGFTLIRIGAAGSAARDPAKQELLLKKEELENNIDMLKYQKAAMPAASYDRQLRQMLIDLARVQAELDK